MPLLQRCDKQMRALGLDLGSKRIGVALSNSEGTMAMPYEVIVRTDMQRDHRRVRDLLEEAEAEIVVVGLPLSLDGTDGPMARKYREEATDLEAAIGVPVELWDERFTTVTAERQLMSSELNVRQRRAVVDKVAASVMLQAWLDSRCTETGAR